MNVTHKPSECDEPEVMHPNQASPKRNAKVDVRRMSRAELLGAHTHQCVDGTKVHVWLRSENYLARGSYCGARFGKTLGTDARAAAIELRQLLVDIDDGRFQRSSESTKQRFAKTNSQRISIRDLFNKFLHEKRQLRGAETEAKYADRLAKVLDFTDISANLRNYPFVMDIDRTWALQLREFMFNLKTTKNGHANGAAKPVSQKHIHNVLETLRNALNWAQSAEVRLIPADWRNPITTEFIGPKLRKDPLRKERFPIAERIKLVAAMGATELGMLAISMVLPLRASEAAGILISEVDLESRHFTFGTRADGADFTKGKTSFIVPFPIELLPIIKHLIGIRREGPLLLGKKFRLKKPGFDMSSNVDLIHQFKAYISQTPKKAVSCENDRKTQFRKFLERRCGGISVNQLSKTFKSVCGSLGLEGLSLMSMRAAVSNSMKQAGINHLELTYLTGHTTCDILNEYVSLDPHGEMAKYFATIKPLLIAIHVQAAKLGIGECLKQQDGQLGLAG